MIEREKYIGLDIHISQEKLGKPVSKVSELRNLKK